MAREILAAVRRPVQIGAWLLVSLLGAFALSTWLRLDPLPRLRTMWLGALVAGLIMLGFGMARVWLAEAHTWRQSTVSWRTIALDLSGFVVTCAGCWTLALYVASAEGWL